MSEITKWLYGVITSTAFISLILFFTRGFFSKLLTKSIDHQFERKLEKFKSEIKDSEKELEQIRSFIVSARRERDGVLQSKRIEAAESLMRSRQFLLEFLMLVEYMKVINIDEVLKKGNDPKITNFIDTLIKPFNIDEKINAYKSFDKILTKLYLGEQTIKMFDVFESIILNAAMMMKIMSVPLKGKPSYLKEGTLSQRIIEMVPASKEGFDKYGEAHAYHWANYFYDEVLKELKNELFGKANMTKDAESAAQAVLDSKNAQIQVRSTLQQHGLSEKYIRSEGEEG